VMDALGRQAASFDCQVVETEFWGAMTAPNLMVELSEQDLGDMMAALSFHVGEVRRNPYHLLVPAWMQDNVRRGGELVGGQGGAAPDFAFCTLYRLRHWRDGGLHLTYQGGRGVPASVNAAEALR
jgi:N-acetylglucosamine malate deacetylase 1